jgi:tetratricopeptide (TPR) repeat protein
MHNPDKMMADLQRLLQTQNFKSKEELEQFMNSLMGQPLPSFPKEALSPQEQAEDLVFEAMELPPAQARKKAKEALKLDPDCIAAYELLGGLSADPMEALKHYAKGEEIGRRIFGGAYLEENAGHFWGLHETRPFMRILYELAELLYLAGEKRASVDLLEEMLALNPMDNQGVRYQLLLYLLELNDFEKFRKYDEMFADEAGALLAFTRALYLFKTQGESAEADQVLEEAMQENRHVLPKLTAARPTLRVPSSYGFGDLNEAHYYTFLAHQIWKETEGAVAWLKKHKGKK